MNAPLAPFTAPDLRSPLDSHRSSLQGGAPQLCLLFYNPHEYYTQMQPMVLEYLPTSLGDFWGKCW